MDITSISNQNIMKKHYNRLIILLVIFLTGINFISCKKNAYKYPPSTVSLYKITVEDSYNFSILRAAIERAGLQDLLNGTAEYTLFAPTNAAFTDAGYSLATIALTPKETLIAILKNHIIAGKQSSANFTGSSQKSTLGTDKILIQQVGGAVYVNGGNIISYDVAASNGYVQVINKLLITNSSVLDVINSGSTTTYLAAAIVRASTGSVNFTQLLNTGTYTLFAPVNSAFIDAGYATVAAVNAAPVETLVSLLKYQIMPGRKLVPDLDSLPQNALSGVPIYFDRTYNTTKKITSSFANGISFGGGASNEFAGSSVIHYVNRIFPSPLTVNTLQRINSDANLSYLSAAIAKASSGAGATTNFTALLSDPLASYTVFAPTNAAFIAKGYPTITAVNAESVVALTNLLRLHMLKKRVNNINIAENGSVATLAAIENPSTGTVTNPQITFTTTGGFKVKGDSNPTSIPVITANIITTNGLINIIGTVLEP